VAYTVTVLGNTVHGNERVIRYKILADATTQTVATGLGVINGINVVNKSATSGMGKYSINLNATGSAAAGSFAMTGIVSGDEYYVTVYGV
jgi:TolB-like protein